MDKYILGVPRNRGRLDFAELLDGIAELEVARAGQLRRVQVRASPQAISEARERLPDYVMVEPEIPHEPKMR